MFGWYPSVLCYEEPAIFFFIQLGLWAAAIFFSLLVVSFQVCKCLCYNRLIVTQPYSAVLKLNEGSLKSPFPRPGHAYTDVTAHLQEICSWGFAYKCMSAAWDVDFDRTCQKSRLRELITSRIYNSRSNSHHVRQLLFFKKERQKTDQNPRP